MALSEARAREVDSLRCELDAARAENEALGCSQRTREADSSRALNKTRAENDSLRERCHHAERALAEEASRKSNATAAIEACLDLDLANALSQIPIDRLERVDDALPRLLKAVGREVLRREAAVALAAAQSASNEVMECSVCLAAPREVAFGCGRLCVCQGCATDLNHCPICRQRVTDRRSIFIS